MNVTHNPTDARWNRTLIDSSLDKCWLQGLQVCLLPPRQKFKPLPIFIKEASDPFPLSFQDPGIQGIASRSYFAGTPFSLTEEFVAVYRMHPLLPETVTLSKNGTGTAYPMASMTFAGAEALLDDVSFQDWLYAFGTSKGRRGHLKSWQS